jgi:hypothetical protein
MNRMNTSHSLTTEKTWFLLSQCIPWVRLHLHVGDAERVLLEKQDRGEIK